MVDPAVLFEPLRARMREENASDETVLTYDYTVREIASIASRLPSEWTQDDVSMIHETWIKKMREGALSAATVGRKVACLRRLMDACGCALRIPRLP